MSYEKQLWTLVLFGIHFSQNTSLTLQDDEFHYLSKVLRLETGQQIELINCCGQKACATIESIQKKEAIVLINQVENFSIQKPQIHVYLGLPKPTTLDDIVLSVSEMGLDELHIFRTQKCLSKAPVKLEKLQKISNEAVRISKSSWSTKIFNYENMNDLLKKRKNEFDNGLNLFCDESIIINNNIQNLLLPILQKQFLNEQNINIFIGPEGSFTQNEREILQSQINFNFVTLGKNILKVQNAIYMAFGICRQYLRYE